MGTITKGHTAVTGQSIPSAGINSNFDTLYNEINGNLDNNNIKAGAAIAATKLNLATVAQAVNFTSTFLLGTANQGDVVYDNGTTVTRLTPGTAGQQLKTGGAGANPSWANPFAFETGSFSRTLTVATGTQVVSLSGSFVPKLVLFLAAKDATAVASWGMDDTTTPVSIGDDNAASAGTYALGTSGTNSIQLRQNGNTDKYEGNISAVAAGQFTISWTKTGSPTGAATILFAALGW